MNVRVRPKRFIARSCLSIIILLILTFTNSFAVLKAQNQEKVESVEVQLNVAGEIYEGLQERIEYSIGRVGEKILLDQPLSLLEANQETVKTAIFNVFSKVLIGFQIEQVDLVIGNHTKVIIYLKPVSPLIQEVKLKVTVSGVSPELEAFIKEITSKIETELNHVFVGLPVESVAWAEGIFNLVANYLLERDLPGFNSKFSLTAGPSTVFDLTLIPQEPVVSEVKVDVKAVNLPVLFVRYKTNPYRARFDILKGLPVEFLSHYQLRLQDYLSQSLNDFPKLQQMGMKVKTEITPGIKTKVALTVDSGTYLTKFDARYFVNNDEAYGNLQAYFGYRTASYELFARGYLLGNDPSGKIFTGCYFPLGPNFTGGFEYEWEHSYKNIGFHFQFERGDYLDLRLGIDSPTEGIIGIYLNNQLNLELVDCNNNLGVQLDYQF